ncbi:MAG: copper-translocating P-type ATPase [Ignavibacteria bacterium RBG_16_34_14]|nr:MAG: copper-translocating P-type ATPase [Ignavibacteria bacterium RBG_16_34_14]
MNELKNQKMEFKRITLPVEGMTCASCIARIEKALSKVDGIEDVNVNFATEKASFGFDPEKADIKKILSVVEDAGYKIDISPLQADVKKNELKSSDKHIESNYEKGLRNDLILSAILTIPILILNMGIMFDGFSQFISLSRENINKILLILTTPVVFISGKRFFSIFWKNLLHFTADMNSLVAIGTGAAFLYSAAAILFPEIINHHEIPHVYFDMTATIITLILFGRWIENRAKRKTGSEIKKLIELQPKTALVKINNEEKLIKIEELKTSDIVIVKPGGRIPADGKIISGFSAVDESMVTGESFPVEKNINSNVIGGTINKTGSFDFEVTAIGDNSVLGQIIKLVEEAQSSKAPIQQLADKVASIFVPVVIGVAVITFAAWLFIGGDNAFNSSLINFVAVLIIACPCALGLATPIAIIVGTGKGAQNGILIKNGQVLELVHKMKAIVFDKTGTLTEGKPVVSKIKTFDINEDDFLMYAASLERKSEHPIGRAICEFAKEKGINISEPESFLSITGKGVEGIIDSKKIISGSKKLMLEKNIDLFPLNNSEMNSDNFKTSVYVAVDNQLKGVIGIDDELKEFSIEAINSIKSMGIKTIMITGDNFKSAKSIAEKIGIDEFKAEVLPEEKSNAIKKFQQEYGITAMVGDGINDAPALAKSDIGIAIGKGTDIAIETAEIVLINDDLRNVVKAIKLSRQTLRTIKQNLFWAFIYNVIGIPLAAFGLLNPIFAALAMSLSSVSVVSNSLRLKKIKL